LQDQVLAHLVSQRLLVDIYLVNGIRLQGYINGFDNYAVFLTKSPGEAEVMISHMIYKHAISTIGSGS
jgi:host factor-I protein